MRPLPNAKIAMAFSDAAGTNACLALAEMNKTQNKPISYLFSNNTYTGLFSANVHVSDEVPDFREIGVSVLFTGTSHPESSRRFECRCMAEARKAGLYVISFIDHWVNFKL